VDNLELATAMVELMVELLREDEADSEVSMVSADELLYAFRLEEREHILDRLNSRTTSEIQRELTLRRAAAARLARPERRSGFDRRLGGDRRSGADRKPAGDERRSGRNRRSGHDRRTMTAAT
jgi:hypothetical protein